MTIAIILFLTIILFYSVRLNLVLVEELDLGTEEKLAIIKEHRELREKINNGDLIEYDESKKRTTKELYNQKKVYEDIIRVKDTEIKNEKNRVAQVIIDADTIAGERAQTLLTKWRQEEETSIRKDAIKRSQNVLKGKVTEHIVPHFDEFPWDARDVRFIGTPLDYIVFEGLSAGNVEGIVFVEVKTGNSAKLSKRERQVRDAILSGKVTYKKIHIKDK